MFEYFLYFIIYSFLGWSMETILFSFKEKRFVKRGFLNGPLCPIYGVGMITILFILDPFTNNIGLLFLFGAILASTLEYLTGFVLEKLFYTRWWDYTKKRFNINGYVCLENTIDWGILCVIMVNFVQPKIEKLVLSFNETWMHLAVYITLSILIVDIIVTVSNLLGLKQYAHSLLLVHENIKNNDSLKSSYNNIHNKLEDRYITINQYINNIKELKNEELNSIEARLDKINNKSLKPRKQLTRLYRNYKTSTNDSQYKSILDIIKDDIVKNIK